MSFMISGGMAAGMAAVSAYGAMESNKAISKASKAQQAANRLYAERDLQIGNEQQRIQGGEVNKQLGLQLTNMMMQSSQAKGNLVSQGAESNIYGNLAQRKQAVLGVQTAMSADNLQQAAEAKMMDIQTGLTDLAYGNDARNSQITNDYNNSMSQQQSTFSILSNSAQAGMSGYSTGMSIAASRAKLP